MIDAEKLNALVDNELEPAERAELEAAVAQDSTAAAHLGSIRALKSAVQGHVRPVPCEDEWKACVKRLNEIDGVKRTKSIVDSWAWAMCSVLFIFIFSVGMFNRSNPGVKAGTGDLTRAGMETPIRDAYHWVKSEFGLTGLPKQPVEARQGSYDGRQVATLHFRDAEGDLSLVLVRGDVRVEGVKPMDDGNHFACQTGEANSVVWSDRGIVMILTGKRDVTELRDISNSIHLGQ
jgi:hypothetical protein